MLLTVNQRQKFGLVLVEDIITIVCVKMLKLAQNKRMKLTMARRILEVVEKYVGELFFVVGRLKQ